MEIKVFDPTLTFCGIVERINEFEFTRSYNDKGIFTLKVPFDKSIFALLQNGNIINYKKFSGVIESITIENEAVTINGYEITYLLARRIVWNTINFSGTVEDYMRKAVQDNCVSCSDTSRNINIVALGTKANLTDTIIKQCSYDNLFAALHDVAINANYGFLLDFSVNDKKLYFEVYKGKNTNKTFSRMLDNVNGFTYIDSLNNYANYAKIGGQGEGTDRVFATVGTATGLDRYEVFVDANGTSKEDGQSDSDYLNVLKSNGSEVLAEQDKISTFDTSVTDADEVELGDNVNVLDTQLGLKLSTFISKIQDIYDDTGHTRNITFGYDVPSIYKIIKG